VDPQGEAPGAFAHRPRPELRPAFVGRERELTELLTALEEARSGRGQVTLLAGEPGIGKSRLADEVAAQSRERDVAVLWGRAWEAGGAPAFWPWVQALRGFIRTSNRDVLADDVGSGASDLAQILPELRSVFPDLPSPEVVDPEIARFRLFDAVSTFLKNASDREPLLVVLDDLHGADTPSLLLLRFVASDLSASRVFIVGAYRDVAVIPGHPMAEAVAELSREPHTRLLRLGGLSDDDVGRFIEGTTGVVPSPAVVAAVHDQTEGNPLFLGELVRLLASEGRLEATADASAWRLSIPPGVRDAITRRLRHLSDRCAETLTLASVLGREFDVEALRLFSGMATSELLAALEEAAEADVVTDAPGALGQLRFSHALIRDALYDQIPVPRRYEAHREAGEALEGRYAADPDPHLSELAHHFVEAAPAGGADRAVTYARRAAERAVRLLAYEEASRLYVLAIEASRLADGSIEDVRGDLLLALGDARARAGDLDAAKQAFREAAEIAGRVGRPDRLARAALGYGGRFVWARAGGDPHVRPLLERAIGALGREESTLRARVMARLAGVLRDEPEREPRWSLSADALSMAQTLGDPATLAYALEARFAAVWEPETVRERLAHAEEMVRVAATSGDKERELQAHGYRWHALVELGDISAARSALRAKDVMTEELGQPAQRWLTAVAWAVLALLEGRFVEAEQLVSRALMLGQRAQSMDAEVSYRLQTYALRREQDRIDEIEETIVRSVDGFPWYPMFRSVVADVWVRLGRLGEARPLFEELARDRFAFLPRDSQWLFGLTLLADVARSLEDTTSAADLYELLLPYAHHNAYSPPELCTGSVSRPLGILAWVARHGEEADRHFREALDANRRMGARPWLARTQHDYARMLLARGAQDDRSRADELLAEALETCRNLGMTALEREVTAPLGTRTRRTGGPRRRLAGPAVFSREGDYWTIAFDGKEVRLRDAKGLRYLHRLISEPGREFHVAELVSPAGPGSRPTEDLSPDAGHAGEILDATAKEAYRLRVEDLRVEIEEAEGWNDAERAARAREGLEAIASQLAKAYGLGGRARRAAETSERIRKAVTNRIRHAIGRIQREHPQLAAHLANAISTGTFCSYRPELPVPWEL
jgi:tetratricopeptide (TPR) repeat protein